MKHSMGTGMGVEDRDPSRSGARDVVMERSSTTEAATEPAGEPAAEGGESKGAEEDEEERPP